MISLGFIKLPANPASPQPRFIARNVLTHAIVFLLCASGYANSGTYPAKPIRLIVPSAPGGLDASREQGSRLRDSNVRESAADAWMMAQASSPREQYPSKPVRMVVPSAPGGGIDFTGRVLAFKLGALLGQQVVVDNRAGASGILGADTVAKATPDGHTLLVASSSLAVIPSLYPKLPYDILHDFSPVSLAARTPNLLVVHPAVPARSVSELIALAKAQPAKLNFSSSGVGRASHMAAERFKLMADVQLIHIAYQGTGPAVTAVIAGEVELIFGTIPAVLPHIKSGRLRALGIGSLKRSSVVPEIPTIAETGLPGYEADTWYGLVAPAATPRPVIATLNEATLKSLQSADTRARFLSDGSEPAGSTPEEFQRFIAAEVARWGKVVRSAGLRAE